MSLNRYSYVHNNPVLATDPSGLVGPGGGCFQCGGEKVVKANVLSETFTLPDLTNVHTAGGCLISTAGLGLYAQAAICGIVDESGEYAILLINGGGIYLGGGASITFGYLFSNGMSVTDQAGPFVDFDGSIGYGIVGGGASTSSGTNAQGVGINTTVVTAGVAAGTPVAFSFGKSYTTVVTDEELIKLYRAQFGSVDPFAIGASILADSE